MNITDKSKQEPVAADEITVGTHGGYVTVHIKARKFIAQSCEQCGTTERLQAALRPGVEPSRLRVNPKTRVLYSVDYADYHALCPPCHVHHDSRVRHGQAMDHCKRGHEYTPENTYRPPRTGVRVCRTCKRKAMRDRLNDPEKLAKHRKNSRDYARRRRADEQQAQT